MASKGVVSGSGSFIMAGLVEGAEVGRLCEM